MTILSVCQEVSQVIGLERPLGVMSSTEREHRELSALANEMAERILKAHDWELLKTLATLTGDGSTTAFDLPSDYERMPKKQGLWSSRLSAPLQHVTDHDRWLERITTSFNSFTGAWTKLGGQIHILPAMVASETAKFYYVSNLIVAPESGANQTGFLLDGDTFRLSERLLKLGMIWQWKANKGLPYEEDMENFETLLSRLIDEDQGPEMLRIGRNRIPSDAQIAYPWALDP